MVEEVVDRAVEEPLDPLGPAPVGDPPVRLDRGQQLAAPLVYLPAKFRIRFLEPIPTDQWGEAPWEDAGLVQTIAEDVRGRIQEELYEMLARRRSPWLG